MSGFSRATEIGRRKCIEKASGRERVNATINYPFRARAKAHVHDADIAALCVPRIRKIMGSSFNDRDSLSSGELIDPPGFESGAASRQQCCDATSGNA